MKISKRSWLLVLAVLLLSSTAVLGQGRIELVQGRRAITDKVTFTVEVAREKRAKDLPARNADAPDDLQIFTSFATQATGRVYLDGKALGRFDDAMGFNSNLVDITYGRHTMTLVFTNPAIVTRFIVTVRGGAPREILDGEEAVIPDPSDLQQRVTGLERKVQELEAEVASLKKKRNH